MQTYGYTRDKEGQITGEQDTLRYSAFDLWCKSKKAYRERYYEGKSLQTVETVFGHEVHKKLEKGEIVIEGLPRYPKTEYNIEVKIGKAPSQIKIGGCLDAFDPDTLSFLDYKSSHLSREGKVPWNRVKVAKHMQLVFYSLLVQEKHRKVNPLTHLIWLETKFQSKTIEYDGHTLEAQIRTLDLTGTYQVFPRYIPEWARVALRKLILEKAKEISDDFNVYKNKGYFK